MATTQDYLDQLITDKQSIVDNINIKGGNAEDSDTFTELAPKILTIPSGESNVLIPYAVFGLQRTATSAEIIEALGGLEKANKIAETIYAGKPVYVTDVWDTDDGIDVFPCYSKWWKDSADDTEIGIYLCIVMETGHEVTSLRYDQVNQTWAVNQDVSRHWFATQVDTMPEPSSTNVGEVYQYTGPDTQGLDHGHFYEVVEKEISGVVTYEYQEIGTQAYSADASDPEVLSSVLSELDPNAVSTIYVKNFGPNGDYNGYIVVQPTVENDINYTYLADNGEIVTGDFDIEEDIETGELIVNYSKETIGSFDTTVRQAKEWHLNDNNTTWQSNHAVYEDFQWIFNEWTTQDTYITPNFQVDGYYLVSLALYNSSQANDYKRYKMLFTKLVGTSNYYYEVYFYTHYNTTTIYDETSSYKASKNGRYTSTFLTSHQSLSNYLAKNNTTSFIPTGDYNPATKKYVDDTAVELEAAIEEASIQVDIMPTPSAINVGEVYQYTGPDTQDLDHGHFYEIVEKEVSGIVTYEYQDIGITVGVTTAVAPQEITDITYGAYRRYPGYSETGLQLLQNNNGQLIWGQTVNSIWIGTQQEYDDLPEHFDTMIYFIKKDE